MNGETNTTEDLTILAVVEEGIAASDGTRGDETADTLRRLYTEVLGLIPFEAEPEAPPPAARERLLAALAGDLGDETQPAPAVPVAPAAVAAVAAPEPVRPVPAPVPVRASQEMRTYRPATAGAGSVPVRAPSRWPLTLAASLAFLFLGLAAWLFYQVQDQNQTIARLNQELTLERTQAAGAYAQVRRLETDNRGMDEKLSLVTTRAAMVAPMKPVGAPPMQPAARGVLYVADDHQHWYMTLHGLAPADAGKTYKLWFVGGQGPVSAGTFTARTGDRVELSSKQMPAGTTAAMVTLESDPQAAAPSGPEVLRAAAMYEIG
ncbi:MAG: anti-sigma factor [Thermoanaerobaculia bacterium]